MNNSLIHRGPDDEGYFLGDRVGFAIRRLSIIDIAGGQQPIFNEDQSIVVVFNGEIYNFQALRSELETYGHQFKSASDTEVIVHAYEEWGDEALLKLNGMFAIALWDDRRQRLLLARDRMGKKPLYWHESSRGLVWGSEIKSLLELPWIRREVNNHALHHYLTLQYVPDPLTMFEGIFQLPAAHKIVIEIDRAPVVSRWWQLNFGPKFNIRKEEAVEQARDLLSAAVQRRMISEVPLGAFLSGGIDSSLVVALMAEASSRPVKTFTIGFDEKHFSELPYARQVAQMYETDHHEYFFRPADLVSVIKQISHATDEPLADPAALPLFELARQARQKVTVALCGDGGDESLAGYRRYAIDGLIKPYAALPDWLTQQFVPALVKRLPEPTWMPEDRNFITGLKRLGQFSAVTHKASLIRWGSYFSHQAKLNLYTAPLRESLKTTMTTSWLEEAYDQAKASNLLDCTLYTDHVTYLSGDLLPKTDRTTMAHSLEARAPFLDPNWIEWTARLPTHYKVRGLSTKWLLFMAFKEKLPPLVAGRGKQGFGVPLGLWLQEDLRDWTDSILVGSKKLNPWFRPEAIRQLMVEHDSGKFNHGKKLWALLMFAVWLDQKIMDPSHANI